MKRHAVVAALLLVSLGRLSAEDKKMDLVQRMTARIEADAVAAPALKKYAAEVLLPLGADPLLVREVRRQNNKKTTVDQVRIMDTEWTTAVSTSTPLKQALLSSAASQEMRRLVKEKAVAVLEAFVMDNQGALVGATNITSDYWQGDEKKWTGSYAAGAGGVDIAAAQFDQSARGVLQQISLPVWDDKQNVIGAVTWGVVLDKIDWNDAAPAAPAEKK